MGKKLVLIDGNSIINRAFFGLPDLTNAQGLHTNAVYGFMNILFRILGEETPDCLVVAFDVHAPTFRHKMYEAYKGTRKGMPDELREQVPVLKKLLAAMHITMMEKAGLEDVEVVIENELRMAIKSQGFNCSVESNSSGVFFYPNSDYKNCCIKLSLHTPLSAVAWYLRMMPVINREIDEVVVKVMHIYDRMVLQQKYHDDLVHLENLMKESAGKPVGKLMKYLRWNLGRFSDRNSIPIQSFKILGDTAFSHIVKDFDFKRTSNGPHPFTTVVTDRLVERWIDAECHHIYASDPCAKDAPEHDNRHSTIQDYLHINPVLSFDFIEQKL